MIQERISAKQLLALIMLFEIGTAIVVPVGLAAGQGVWLSILLALFGGILLFLVYDYLYRQYPDMPLSGYAQKILGKFIGFGVAFFYIPFFIYVASRDLKDAGDLLGASSYDQTPLLAINVLMILTVVYVLRKGIEVLARLGEIYLLIMVVLGAIGIIFVLFSGIIEINNLLPILGNGWKPILKEAYPNVFMFPFGEMICFTTILPYLNKTHLGKNTGIIALISCGIILSFTHAIEISVLGFDMYSRSTFPLYTTMSKVNIAEFIERLDAIVLLTLIIGAFFKIAIFFYSAVIVASDLFKIPECKKLVMPIGLIILFSSMTIASNWADHIEEGKVNVKLILPLYSVIIPILLLVVHLIRKRFGLFRTSKPS